MPVDIYKQAKDIRRAVSVVKKSNGYVPLEYLGKGYAATAWRCGSVAVKRTHRLDFTYYFLQACQQRLHAVGSITHPKMKGLPEVLHIERWGAGYIAVMPVYLPADDGEGAEIWDQQAAGQYIDPYALFEDSETVQEVLQSLTAFAHKHADCVGGDLHRGNIMWCTTRNEWLAVDPGFGYSDPGVPVREPLSASAKPRGAAWKVRGPAQVARRGAYPAQRGLVRV